MSTLLFPTSNRILPNALGPSYVDKACRFPCRPNYFIFVVVVLRPLAVWKGRSVYKTRKDCKAIKHPTPYRTCWKDRDPARHRCGVRVGTDTQEDFIPCQRFKLLSFNIQEREKMKSIQRFEFEIRISNRFAFIHLYKRWRRRKNKEWEEITVEDINDEDQKEDEMSYDVYSIFTFYRKLLFKKYEEKKKLLNRIK